MCARAILTALSTASDPELAKKNLPPSRIAAVGIVGSSRSMSAARGTDPANRFCCALIWSPAWRDTAAATLGWQCPVDTTPMPAAMSRKLRPSVDMTTQPVAESAMMSCLKEARP